MPSINKVILIGHVGRDAETRFTQSGDPITSFSLATSQSYKNKAGEWITNTEWHNVCIMNKALAQAAQEKAYKGTLVYIEGQLKTNKYTDKNSVEQTRTQIVVGMYDGKFYKLEKDVNTDADPVELNAKAKPSAQATAAQGDDIPF